MEASSTESWRGSCRCSSPASSTAGEVISQKQRELCAVASLTVLHRPHELRAHVHAALNVGATRQEVAEVIFQQVTYGGMPVVVDALDVFKAVLVERGEWEDVTVLEAMIDAVRAAGEVALRYYRGGFDVVIKDDRTPVTQADREAEQLIVERLGRVFPDCGFLGEEFGDSGPKDRRFIIDPIDGTKNFVRGIPVWATLLALEEGGEVTAGVVHNPALGEMFWARRGGGAFRNGERVAVSAIVRLGEAQLIHSALRPLREAGYWEGLARLVDATDRQRGLRRLHGLHPGGGGQGRDLRRDLQRRWAA